MTREEKIADARKHVEFRLEVIKETLAYCKDKTRFCENYYVMENFIEFLERYLKLLEEK